MADFVPNHRPMDGVMGADLGRKEVDVQLDYSTDLFDYSLRYNNVRW